MVNENLNWIEEVPDPEPNHEGIRTSKRFAALFDSEVPDSVNKFECADKDGMAKYWPAGVDAALQVKHTDSHSSNLLRIKEDVRSFLAHEGPREPDRRGLAVIGRC